MGTPLHPFQPRALPPAPSAPSLGFGQNLKRVFGSAQAAAKQKFLEACRLFNSGSFREADAAFAQVRVEALLDDLTLPARISFYRAFCAAYVSDYGAALNLIAFVCGMNAPCAFMPHNAPAQALRGRLLYVTGQISAAMEALQRAGAGPRAQADLAVAQREYTADLVRAGQLDEALPWLEYLAPRWPALAACASQIRLNRAWHLYSANQYKEAIHECDAAEQSGCQSPALRNLRGLAHLQLLQPATAQARLDEANQRLAAARRDLPPELAGCLSQLETGLQQIGYMMGAAQLVAGNYAAAIPLLRQTLNSPLPPIRARLFLALALYWSGAPDLAYQEIKSAPIETQQLPEAQYLAGHLALHLKWTEEAYQSFYGLRQTRPGFADVDAKLASAALVYGSNLAAMDPLRSVQVLQVAQNVQPSPQLDRAMARVFNVACARALQTGQYVQAGAHAEQARALDDTLPATRVLMGLAWLGQAAESARAGAQSVTEALRQLEMCLSTWLGQNWDAPENLDRLSVEGLNPVAPQGLKSAAQAVAWLAALLLRQAMIEPENAPALIQRARQYIKMALSTRPAPILACALSGLIAYILDDDWRTAAEGLGAASAAGTSAPGMIRMLAAALFGLRDYAHALPHYRALLADPAQRHPLLACYLAFCLFKTGDLQAAGVLAPFVSQQVDAKTQILNGYLQYAAGPLGVAQPLTILESLYARWPDDQVLARWQPVVVYEAGVARAQAGQWHEAADRLAQIARFPDSSDSSRRALAAVEHARTVRSLLRGEFDRALEYAQASASLDPARRTALLAPMALAQLGQGRPDEALAALDEAQAAFQQAGLSSASWNARLVCLRAIAHLGAASDESHAQAGDLLEQAAQHADAPTRIAVTVLCGAYRWYIKNDVDGAMAAWQSALVDADRAPIVWRLLGMGHLRAGRYADAAQAWASYRGAVREAFPLALTYQAFALLMSGCAEEAKALLPTGGQLDAPQSFLRGYARFRTSAWSGARKDFECATEPRARLFAALSACQAARQWIARENLTEAERLLSEAMQLGGPAIGRAVKATRARLHRQAGAQFLQQGNLAEAARRLNAAFELGYAERDDGARLALALAQFGLAGAQGSLEKMQASADVLKQALPPSQAARVLIGLACQQLRAASNVAAQQPRGMPPDQVRAAIQPFLLAVANLLREAIRFDDARFEAHYLLGWLALKLLDDKPLATVHLLRAQKLAPPGGLHKDSLLAELCLEAGHTLNAKQLYLHLWQKQPSNDRLRQGLIQTLSWEASRLRPVVRAATLEEPATPEETMSLAERAKLLDCIIEQMMGSLPLDRQDSVRKLRSELKTARLDDDQPKLEQLEKEILAQLGPFLLK
jgi:hypothetical protein